MGDGAGRLPQQQTPLRHRRRHPPRPRLLPDRLVVEIGIVAQQRELEPSFAILRAMARARVAAHLGQYRNHVIDEAHRGDRFWILDFGFWICGSRGRRSGCGHGAGAGPQGEQRGKDQVSGKPMSDGTGHRAVSRDQTGGRRGGIGAASITVFSPPVASAPLAVRHACEAAARRVDVVAGPCAVRSARAGGGLHRGEPEGDARRAGIGTTPAR